MTQFEVLQDEMKEFAGLPATEDVWEKRKGMANSLEGQVKAKDIALDDQQFRWCLREDSGLGRILAYLLVENGNIQSTLDEQLANIRTEWERLQVVRFKQGTSTMPLYYAIRAYRRRLGQAPRPLVAADLNATLFQQIGNALPEHGLDAGRQISRLIGEIEEVETKSEDSRSNPTVLAALISRKGVILTAVVAVLVAILGFLGTLATNWDKLPWSKTHSNPAAVSVTNSPTKK